MADETTTTEIKETAEDVLARDLASALEQKTPQASEKQPGEAKPPETKAEPEVKTETTTEQAPAPTEVQLPDEHPSKDNWKAAREQLKRQQEELKAAKAELEAVRSRSKATDALPQQLEATRPDPEKQVRTPPATQKLDPEFVFTVLARATAGELSDAHKREAEDYIANQMTPAELRDVMAKARRGQFGDRSTDILDLARSYSTDVLANHETQKEQQARTQQAEQIRVQTWNKVMQDLPDLNAKDSETFKGFQAANAELASVFPDLWQKPEAPQIVAEFLTLRRDANSAKALSEQLKTLSAENDQLKKRLGIVQAPQATRQAGGNQGAKKSAEDELAESFASLGILAK